MKNKNDSENIHKIYKDTFPDEHFYIGQTKDDVYKRWYKGYNPDTKMGKCIKKFKDKDPSFVPQIDILDDNLSQDMANYLETKYIQESGWPDNPLLLNEEGGGLKGKIISEATKKKISESQGKAVRQFSMDGKYIATYKNIQEAGRILGINASHIPSCIRGKQLSVGNYRWQYDDGKTYPIIQYVRTTRCPVEQINAETGEVINTFISQKEAERATGISSREISRCIRNLDYTTKGFKWRRLGP